MNVYFYSDDGNQHGPVSYDDLKKAGISKETLVWRDGFDDWQEAGSVPELNGLFVESAPTVVPAPLHEPILSGHTYANDNKNEKENEDVEIDNTKMFKNAFTFVGRARRLEFGIVYVVYFVMMMIAMSILEADNDSGFLSFLSFILMIGGMWLFLSEGTRRCHDVGHSGFWLLIPYYVLWLLFQNSKVGSNEYGNNPKGENTKKEY